MKAVKVNKKLWTDATVEDIDDAAPACAVAMICGCGCGGCCGGGCCCLYLCVVLIC